MLMHRAETFEGLSAERLDAILEGIGNVRIGLVGDLCLDLYWKADMTKSELSRETPHFTLPIVQEWMSPGGGGNTAANIAALKPKNLYMAGVIGNDWRGNLLQKEFEQRNIKTTHVTISNSRVTDTFCKPLKQGFSNILYEDARLDFNNYVSLPREDEEKLLSSLEEIIEKIDLLCVNDQLLYGCISPAVRDRIILAARQGLKVVVDSRDRIGLYFDVLLKPNEVEGYRTVFCEEYPSDVSFEKQQETAVRLSERNNSAVCMTLGSNGCLYVDHQKKVHIPSNKLAQPIDICGAGDTFLSAFSCALAMGAPPWEAGAFANLASEVTIKKIGTTGTAGMDEIRKRYMDITTERG